MNVDATLRRACRAAASLDGDGAIAALLAAWRVTRHPALADALDAVSARFVAEAELRFIDLDSHLRSAADPRVAKALVAMLQALPASPSADDVRRAAWLLTVVADARTLAPIRALRAQRPWARDVLEPVERHLAALPAPPPLGERARSLVDALVAGELPPRETDDLDAAGEAALLRAVRDTPDDDAPRLVYADWLSERGDPRGELIVLQCARAATGAPPSPCEEALLDAYGRAWLGAIEPCVARGGARFARGFLDACRLVVLPWAADDPTWATVTALDVGRAPLGDLHRLLGDGARLPSLVRLRATRLRDRDEVAAVAATPVGRRLRALEIALFWSERGARPPTVDALVDWLRADGPPALRTLALVGDASSVTLSRRPGGDISVSVSIGARERQRVLLLDTLREQLGDRFTIDVDKPPAPR